MHSPEQLDATTATIVAVMGHMADDVADEEIAATSTTAHTVKSIITPPKGADRASALKTTQTTGI